MLQGPRYYCPPGVGRPTHRDDLVPAELYAGKGPDVAGGGPGGGLVYGGIYEDGERGWELTEAGWWFHLGQARPQHLVRLDPHPALVRWQDVYGASPDQLWRVPVLLTRTADTDGPAIYVSALERTWRGGTTWDQPAGLTAIQEQLRAAAYGIALSGDLAACHTALVEAVLATLELGHRVSRIEVARAGWLTERVLLRIARVALDIPPDGA